MRGEKRDGRKQNKREGVKVGSKGIREERGKKKKRRWKEREREDDCVWTFIRRCHTQHYALQTSSDNCCWKGLNSLLPLTERACN